ncbi:MAG: hypothetical protein K0R54_5940, partial [Clostridiaceae bacterium]|nr:hypothetical protein [Clostridiaceae bacterium]
AGEKFDGSIAYKNVAKEISKWQVRKNK